MRIERAQMANHMWREWIRPLAVIIVLVGAVRSSLASWYDVPTGSMEPSILVGDRVFVNKLAYDLRVPFTGWEIARWSSPKRGDVVVFASPANGERLIKRVVGVAGDTVELRDNRLLINGQPAAYGPLDGALIDLIDEPGAHRFAREVLTPSGGAPGGTLDHPVMLTPGARFIKTFGPVTVPPGQIFVMGDNRDVSADSRVFGFVDERAPVGKATAIVWSLDGWAPRRGRFVERLP
jgi:signal peptidase I